MNGIPKAALLDLDGTIVHFAFDAKRARSEIAEMLVENGIPQELFRPEYRISEIFNKFEEYLDSNLVRGKRERLRVFKRRMNEVVEKYEMEGAKNTIIISGVVEALEELKGMGIKLAVVTNNSLRPTSLTLQKIGLEAFLDIILTREAIKFMKPHTQPIETVLKRLGIQASEAIFVGDSPLDMKAARTAGVVAIGVTTGIASEETLRASGAEHVLPSLRQLPSMIKRIHA